MKKHILQKWLNKVLAICTIVTFIISILFWLVWFELIPLELLSEISKRCALYFSMVPFLYLQLLLCKNAKKSWIKVLPLAVIVALVLVGYVGYNLVSSWIVIYLVILMLCAGPSSGCTLGFIINWFWKKRYYRINKIGYALMLAFPFLVVGICVFRN